MDKYCVSGIHRTDVVSTDHLVDNEDDDLKDGHDSQLEGRGLSKDDPEADEDGGGGEVRREESGQVHVDVRPPAGKASVETQVSILEGTALYAGFLLAPAEGFAPQPRLVLPFG